MLLCLILSSIDSFVWAQDRPQSTVRYKSIEDISYRDDSVMTKGTVLTEEMRSRCRLDLYVPENQANFATVVWFHGGGLKEGNKSIPKGLKEQGIAVVAPNYRLSPSVQAPAYIEDAAAAVAWTIRNIEGFGGSSQQIFVAGHSAGGYLTSMIGLDKRWLDVHGVDADSIAGLIPLSGQSITHFTVRAERGIPSIRPIIDDLAPLYHVRKLVTPMLLISGDRNRELSGRYEETAYFWRMLREAGNTDIELLELQGYDHGGMAEPSFPLLLRFLRETSQTAP